MKSRALLFLLIIGLILIPIHSFAVTNMQLAEYYAPVFYQETADAFDRITKVNFDDSTPGNNYDNAEAADGVLPAYVYYSVIESETNYFIYYIIYHPWVNVGGFYPREHETDGIMVIVAKDGTTYGNFLAVETMSNNQVAAYKETAGNDVEDASVRVAGNYIKFYDDNYSSVEDVGNHPVFYIARATNGHRLRNWVVGIVPDSPSLVMYYYAGSSDDAPTVGNSGINNSDLGGDKSNLNPTGYSLIDMFSSDGLWNIALNNSSMFDTFIHYYGYNLGWNQNLGASFVTSGDHGASAALPWLWDDAADGTAIIAGDWFLDPVRTVFIHLVINSNYSFKYQVHPFFIWNGKRLDPNSPNITSYSVRSITVGQNYIYDMQANNVSYFDLLEAPTGMTINHNSGYINWYPDTPGIYHIIAIASNSTSFALQHYTLTVMAPPHGGSSGGGGGGCTSGSSNTSFPAFLLIVLLPLLFVVIKRKYS